MYLALRDGPRGFTQDFSCPGLLGIQTITSTQFRLRDFHPLRSAFPDGFAYHVNANGVCPTTPPITGRFRLFPVRSPLLRESLLFSLPAATKMFQFTAFALPYCYGNVRTSYARVAPFGYSRISARLQLPGNFRSLPRPSSPPGAKASIVCPFLFRHIDFFTRSHVYVSFKDLNIWWSIAGSNR